MTAAYMTRCVYLTFFGEYRGHGHPHESGPRITVPLWILAVPGRHRRLRQHALRALPRQLELRFEHFYEPRAPTSRSSCPTSALPSSRWASPPCATRDRPARHRPRLPLVLARRRARTGITERNRRGPRRLHGCSGNKYYFDWLYTDVIVGGVKGPIARAVNWFNQNVIDGVVNGAGRLATVVGRFVYTYIDQQVVDGAVNGSGRGRQQRRPGLPPAHRPARSSSTAPSCSGRPPSSPAPSSSSSDGYRQGSRFHDGQQRVPDRLGPDAHGVPAAGRGAGDAAHPQGRGGAPQVVALAVSLAAAGVGIAVFADFDYDAVRRRCSSWSTRRGSTYPRPLRHRHRRHVAAADRADAAGRAARASSTAGTTSPSPATPRRSSS